MQWIEFQAAKSNPWKGTKQILCKCWKALDADRVRVIPRVCSISSRRLQRLSYNSYKALELQSISELKSPLSYKFLHNATAPPGLNFQAAQLSLLAKFCIYLHSSLAFCTFWWISTGTGLIGANIVHPLFSHTVAPNRTRLNIKMHSFQSSIGWSWTLPVENALSDEFPAASRLKTAKSCSIWQKVQPATRNVASASVLQICWLVGMLTRWVYCDCGPP